MSDKINPDFTSDDFRKELTKLLPGYKWTVHRTISTRVMSATGIQSSGFNRLSTIEVMRRHEAPWYEVAGYGYGAKSGVMGRSAGSTLARAIRGLQDFYAGMRGKYSALESAISEARNHSA